MNTAINDAIAAAREAAGAVANQVIEGQMANAGAGTAVSTNVQRGAPMSMDDLMLDGGLTPDQWIKIDEHGIHVGGKKPILEEILGLELDLSMVKAKKSIKYGAGPTYKHTYDSLVSTEGESWTLVCSKAAQVDPKAREYRSADIPLVVVDKIPGLKGETLAEAGQELGLTLSTTAWRNWQTFYNLLVKQGVDTKNDVIKVNLKYEVRNKGTNTWGVPSFELAD